MQVDTFFGEEISGAAPVEVASHREDPWAESPQGDNDARRRLAPAEIGQVAVDEQIIAGGQVWDFTAVFRMLMNIATSNDAHNASISKQAAAVLAMPGAFLSVHFSSAFSLAGHCAAPFRMWLPPGEEGEGGERARLDSMGQMLTLIVFFYKPQRKQDDG